MATDDYNVSYTAIGACGGGLAHHSGPSRKRIVELTKIAYETIAWLEKKGVTTDECCVFGQLCDKMFNAPKEK